MHARQAGLGALLLVVEGCQAVYRCMALVDEVYASSYLGCAWCSSRARASTCLLGVYSLGRNKLVASAGLVRLGMS